MKISQIEKDHAAACLNPQPNKPYEELVVLQRSDRSRSMDEGYAPIRVEQLQKALRLEG